MYHNSLPCVAGGLKWNGYDDCGDGSGENDCENVSSCLESVKNLILAPVTNVFSNLTRDVRSHCQKNNFRCKDD